MATLATEPATRPSLAWTSYWPLFLGLAVLAGPTIATLGTQVWNTEAGGHGPVVLATGAWLIWTQMDQLRREGRAGAPWLTALMLLGSLAIYAFGRAYDYISLEAAGLWGVGVSMMHAEFGFAALLRIWFPLLYLGFMVPPPGWLVDSMTAPLKEFASFAATTILSAAGVPIFREGVTLQVAEYQLLVEDACSGMNSLTGLVAISLFYIYLLRRASWRYALLLTGFVIPIAIFANVVRVIVLVLLTYTMGDAVAQGFLHKTAGLFLFATALVTVFALDHLLASLLLGPKKAVA